MKTVFCIALLLPSLVMGQSDRYRMLREAMVRNAIESEGIDNPLVLDAMKTIPRHEFVKGRLKTQAYQDTALPIGNKQTISPPFVVAYMTQTIDPQPDDRVLEIGTGSGYQAAVLAHIVKDVYSIEIVPDLAKTAKKRLADLEYDNVHTKAGDGYLGWPEAAPFDKVIVTCSPENVPVPLVEQLREGGQMLIPIGERYQQSFYLLKKVDGKMEQQKLIPTLFVPMTGTSEEQRRVLPDPDRPQLINPDFEADNNEDEKLDGWHYQRLTEICTDSPMSGSRCIRFSNTQKGRLSQGLQGTAVNGQRIAALDFSVWARRDTIIPGSKPTESAAMVVHFYDTIRREVGTQLVQRWKGTSNWEQARRRVLVPSSAREMIVRIGLNGATGTLDLDAIKMVPVPR